MTELLSKRCGLFIKDITKHSEKSYFIRKIQLVWIEGIVQLFR